MAVKITVSPWLIPLQNKTAHIKEKKEKALQNGNLVSFVSISNLDLDYSNQYFWLQIAVIHICPFIHHHYYLLTYGQKQGCKVKLSITFLLIRRVQNLHPNPCGIIWSNFHPQQKNWRVPHNYSSCFRCELSEFPFLQRHVHLQDSVLVVFH